jgi:hypothetical protein
MKADRIIDAGTILKHPSSSFGIIRLHTSPTQAMDFQLQVALASVAAVAIYFWCKRHSHPHFPPGPPSLPIIGSALSIPRDKEWLVFTKWAKEYGMH